MGSPLDTGALVADKYRVIACLGRGGMADVWLARDERLGKLWAIKEIKPNVGGVRGELLRQALVDEADFIKRLDHPAIPRIVDMVDEGRTLFVVMDYVDGRSLGALLRMRETPFSEADVISWGIQLCDVLEYLHRHDPPIVYRDMKPANVIVRDDGSVRLIDFGIAVECAAGADVDAPQAGTPGYAAPEQLPPDSPASERDGRASVGPAADVYALGTTLYSLVTGHVPAPTGAGGTSFSLRPIRAWNPQLSEGLERVIARATRRDPQRRYPSVAEMRYDLEHHEELTHEWREAQRGKVRGLRARGLAAVACVLVGGACLLGSAQVRTTGFAELMHAAETASCAARDGQESDAELLCWQAMELEPDNAEACWALLRTYEDDYRLTADEAERWQRACGRSLGLSRDPSYAELCFEAGVCYLSYFGVDRAGGSVGNAGIESVSSAAPWFRRAIDAGAAGDGETPALDEQQERAARVYLTLADFYDQVTRAGREGTTATQHYRAFWEALREAVERENALPDARRSAEGVRMRLCQVGTEVLASSTYLAGCARAGVGEDEARALLGQLRVCADDLAPFAQAQEYAQVFGPMFEEIRAGLSVAERTIADTYENPVLAWAPSGEGAGDELA